MKKVLLTTMFIFLGLMSSNHTYGQIEYEITKEGTGLWHLKCNRDSINIDGVNYRFHLVYSELGWREWAPYTDGAPDDFALISGHFEITGYTKVPEKEIPNYITCHAKTGFKDDIKINVVGNGLESNDAFRLIFGIEDGFDITVKDFYVDHTIHFADNTVQQICVENWDADGDGSLSVEEAASVTDLGTVFRDNFQIKNKMGASFDELQFFIGLNSIGDLAFNNSSATYEIINGVYVPRGLTSVTIPITVTTIGERAFNWCMALNSVTIPSSVTSICYGAFESCENLLSIYIPSNVTNIGERVFSYCGNLTSIQVSDSNKHYDSRNNCNAIIETESNMLIYGCQNTTIPFNIESIGKYAFAGCDKMTSVNIPANVVEIGDYAFSQCNGLKSITVDDSNITFDSRNGCNAIIETESNTLVLGCQNTIIPQDIKCIGISAFCGCTGLTSVVLPMGLTNIGENAFNGCQITSVNIPSSVTQIDYSAFVNCHYLSAVHITDLAAWCDISFNNIASNPLYYAHNLYLNGDLIRGDLVIPNGVCQIPKTAFISCNGLTSVTIPEGVTSIGPEAFEYCVDLASAKIPSSVTTIGWNAFYGCGALSSLNIPRGVTSIGAQAFFGCNGLTSVSSFISVPFEITQSVFSVYDTATLYVPKGTMEKYKTTPAWSMFKNIEEIEPKGDVNGDQAVNVADIGSVIDVMAAGTNEVAADVNGDGNVDVADIATIIDIMAGK